MVYGAPKSPAGPGPRTAGPGVIEPLLTGDDDVRIVRLDAAAHAAPRPAPNPPRCLHGTAGAAVDNATEPPVHTGGSLGDCAGQVAQTFTPTTHEHSRRYRVREIRIRASRGARTTRGARRADCRGPRLLPRRAAQRSGRPGARRTSSASSASSTSSSGDGSSPSDSDSPGEGAGPLATAARLAPSHSFAHCCPACGSVLLYSDGQLVCADRRCTRWGRSA